MQDKRKTKAALIRELEALRQRLAELESEPGRYGQKDEKAYHSLLQELGAVIYEVNPDRVVTFVSPSLRPAEIVGQPFVVLVHPEDVTEVEAQFQMCLSRRRECARFRFRLLTETGSIRWVQTAPRPIVENDNVVGLRGMITDVSELVETQEALQQRNRELALLNQAAQTFLSTLEMDAVLSIVLDQMRYFLGVTACSVWLLDSETGELVCRRVTNPQARLVQGWRLTSGQGLVGWAVEHGVSLNVADASADPRHFTAIDEQTGLPLRSILTVPLKIKGRVIGALQAVDVQAERFSAIDVALVESLAATAAVAIENAHLYEELKASQQWARNIIDSSLDAIIAVDVNRHIVEFNRAAQEIFGYRPDEVLGQHVSMLYADERESQTMFEATVEQGQCIRQVTNRRKNGETFVSLLAASVLRNERGEFVGLMGVSRDITEQLEIEQELHRHRHHLEELVAERTRKLAEAYERLTELDRIKTKFIADISHELRTPLSNIRLYIQLLQSGPPEKRDFYLSALEQQSEQLVHFFEDILSFATLELEEPRFTTIDFNQLVFDVIAGFKPRATKAGLALEFEPTRPLPPVRGVIRQLDRLVTELVDNAVTYTESGQVTVRTSLAPDNYICLEVRDTGRGILEEDQPYVFRKFYRGKGVGSSNIPGTGLGLAIVREIVNRHEGKIWMESQPGQGSTFTVWLPAAD